jgi:hypothetical protein
LSSLGPDPFEITVDDSLPLACRPQLLQPICRKEDLFGRFLYDQTAAKYSQLSSQLGLSRRERSIPDFLQPNYLKSTHRHGRKQSNMHVQSNSSFLFQMSTIEIKRKHLPMIVSRNEFERMIFMFVSIGFSGMAVDVLLDLSAGLISSDPLRARLTLFCFASRSSCVVVDTSNISI